MLAYIKARKKLLGSYLLLRFFFKYFSNFVKLSCAFDSVTVCLCICGNEKCKVNKNYHKSHTH